MVSYILTNVFTGQITFQLGQTDFLSVFRRTDPGCEYASNNEDIQFELSTSLIDNPGMPYQ